MVAGQPGGGNVLATCDPASGTRGLILILAPEAGASPVRLRGPTCNSRWTHQAPEDPWHWAEEGPWQQGLQGRWVIVLQLLVFLWVNDL